MDVRFREAVEAFRRGDLETALAMAKVQPHSAAPEWEYLLGLIECRRGNAQGGVAHLEIACGAQPQNGLFRLMLARALIDAGRAGAVLAMPEPPKKSATDLALWHVRAEAAEKLRDRTASAQAWRAVTAITPGDHRAWLNLGRSLLRLESLIEAQDAYRRSLAIAPLEIAAIDELAQLYERTNELAAMADLLDSAAASGIAKDRLPFAWALLEQRHGNAQEARRLLDTPGADQDRTRWYRLLAKVEEMLGNGTKAFAAAVEMNRTVADDEAWRRRASSYREELRALAQHMSNSWQAPAPTLPAVRSPSPAFIVGFPRSGTTLLDTFMMGHPDIEVLEELPLLTNAGRLLGPLQGLPGASAAAKEAAREEYLRELAAAARLGRARQVIDKFPLNMVAAPLIHFLFPGAPVIFVKRHPCDCVLSGFMQSFVSNLGNSSFLDLNDAADFYDACMTVWTTSAKVLPLNVHSVRYEDLVSDPEATLRPVVQFLGLEWAESMLDHQSTAKRRGPIPNTSYNQVTEPLNAAPVQRWRRYANELQPVLPVLLPWAEALGYEV